MIVIAEDSVRFAHSAPSTQSTSSRYCGTRILRALLPSPRERGTIGYKLSRDKGGLLTGLWHGYPAHRSLGGILAWQRGLLTGLWHGDPAYKYLRAIPA